VAGDDEATALQDRPEIRAILAGQDPVRLLACVAEITSAIMARAEPIHRILVSAAGSDLGAASLLAEQNRERQHGQGLIASALVRSGALRAELPERDAADVIHALMSP